MVAQLQALGDIDSVGTAEYVWLDAQGRIWSKTRVVPISKDKEGNPFPLTEHWTTTLPNLGQMVLSPCHFLTDPLRPPPAYIVLCEIRDRDDVTVPFNHRARLREAKPNPEFWWGVQQPFTFNKADSKTGASISEKHLQACFSAGLMLHSTKAHGPPEFKLGPRRLPEDFDPEPPEALTISDHLLAANHLLIRLAQAEGLEVVFFGCTVFFSTPDTRARKVDIQKVAEELRIRMGPKHPVATRVSVSSRHYTTLEIKGFEVGLDPYLLLGRVIDPIHKGRKHGTEESRHS